MFFGQNLPMYHIIKLYCLAFSYEWNIKHLMFHYSYVDSYVDSKYLTTRPSLFLIKLRNYLQKTTMCFLSICSWPSGRKIGQPQYSYLDLYFYSYRYSISIFYGWYYIWHQCVLVTRMSPSQLMTQDRDSYRYAMKQNYKYKAMFMLLNKMH